MKGYIVQGGDPENTGKGGQSIWNRKFRDEFDPSLKVFTNINTNSNHIITIINSMIQEE